MIALKYSELDIEKLNDNDIYDLIMTGVIDYAGNKPNEKTNPDFLIVLGCSPIPLKARIVKMMQLYKAGFGKYILLSGGTGWHKLFKSDKKTFRSNKDRLEYMQIKASKYKSMKLALQAIIPDDIKPGINRPKRGKGLYKYMHRKLKQFLEKSEAQIGYSIMKACQDIISISDDKIFFEHDSKNTVQNLEYSKKLLDDLQKANKVDKVNRIMIITSSFHCRRAELSFKKYFPDIDVLSCLATMDIKDEGLSFTKCDLMNSTYYMQQFRNELSAIINYTRNGSVSDLDVEDVLGDERTNEIMKKTCNASIQEC